MFQQLVEIVLVQGKYNRGLDDFDGGVVRLTYQQGGLAEKTTGAETGDLLQDTLWVDAGDAHLATFDVVGPTARLSLKE
jgi:hypothetical protein